MKTYNLQGKQWKWEAKAKRKEMGKDKSGQLH